MMDVASISKLLAFYEIYKRILNVPGDIIEMGVGTGLHMGLLFALRRLLEPSHDGRCFVGFDTFGGGIPHSCDMDEISTDVGLVGDVEGGSDYGDTRETILGMWESLDANCDTLGRDGIMIELPKGDIMDTLPEYIERRPGSLVALLSLDLDVYQPTKLAIELLVPRMPKGAVIVFDQLGSIRWPGEALAVRDTLGIATLHLERVPWQRDQCFAVI